MTAAHRLPDLADHFNDYASPGLAIVRAKDVDALVAKHRAALDLAESQTDDKWLLNQIARYQRRVNWFATHGRDSALGMLGDNGIGPGIADTCRTAAMVGKWDREADKLAADIRAVNSKFNIVSGSGK